jgi:hypothetical protein
LLCAMVILSVVPVIEIPAPAVIVFFATVTACPETVTPPTTVLSFAAAEPPERFV